MQYQRHPVGCQPQWRRWLGRSLELLLPQHCLLCHGRARGVAICEPCLGHLPRAAYSCPLCALPVAQPGQCGACQTNPPAWDFAVAALLYEFPVDILIGLLKFRRCLAAGPVLARCMLQDELQPPSAAELLVPAVAQPLSTSDLLVPVPLHWTRLAARGYNQSLELALALSRLTGLQLDKRGLRRRRRTPAQAGLDAATRRRNLRDAFVWQGPSLCNTRVLLVDDVMTTGSTAAACARVLRAAGAAQVGVWVAARAVKGDQPTAPSAHDHTTCR